MNVEQRQAATDPQTKPADLVCESACRLLSSTSTVAESSFLYYFFTAVATLFFTMRDLFESVNSRNIISFIFKIFFQCSVLLLISISL